MKYNIDFTDCTHKLRIPAHFRLAIILTMKMGSNVMMRDGAHSPLMISIYVNVLRSRM